MVSLNERLRFKDKRFDAILIDNPSKSINSGKDGKMKCHTCI